MNLGDIFVNYNLAVASVRKFAISAELLGSEEFINVCEDLQVMLEFAYECFEHDFLEDE